MSTKMRKTEALVALAFDAMTRVSDLTGAELPTDIREPDFVDDGQAFWIGADGTVSLPTDRLGDPKVVQALDMSGWYARRRVVPFEHGFDIVAHADLAPTHPALPENEAYALWRFVQDAMLDFPGIEARETAEVSA